MYLKQLAVRGLRNLAVSQLQFSSGANLFYGANGSGKTSLLEAIYLLGRGRSFRTRNLRSVINDVGHECTVFGLVHCAAPMAIDIPIGVSRSRGGQFRFRIAGSTIQSAALLIEQLPIQLLNSDSFSLLEGAPQDRRRLLDWGVFHVEQQYRSVWFRYQRSLKQRNSLLRHAKIDPLQLSYWDAEFLETAEQLSQLREHYLESYLPTLQAIARRYLRLPSPDLQFLRGWDNGKALQEVLSKNFERDRQSGRTNAGPHKADLRVTYKDRPVAEVLSRGQLKVLATCMQIAQGYDFSQKTSKHCVYLLDDLVAELDKANLRTTCELLSELKSQVFLTGIERADLENAWPGTESQDAISVFHVEHGTITAASAKTETGTFI